MRNVPSSVAWLLLPMLLMVAPACGDDDDDSGHGDGDADADGDGDADGGPDGGEGAPFCGNGARDGADECEGLDGCAAGEECTETCTCAAVAPIPTTSQSLIAEALERGDIDYATSLVYRAWALFADSRLPPEYDGEAWQWEDNGLFREARLVWDSLDAATQDDLLPFLLRPDEPGSYFSPLENQGGPVNPGTVHDCPYQPNADTRDWRSSTSDSSPFVVWSCGGGDPAQDPHRAKREAALAIAEQVHRDMTPDTGMPAPDDDRTGPKIDVYLIDANTCKTRGAECIVLPVDGESPGLAAAVGTSPCGPGRTGAQASSSFFMVDVGAVPAAVGGSPVRFRYVFAHEFFHLIQNALNLQVQGGGCRSDGTVNDTVSSWLVEASAEWASRAYYPDDYPGRRTDLFTLYQERDQTRVSLLEYGAGWDYQAFIYPLFVQQELDGRRRFISVWTNSGGASTPADLDDVLDRHLPFAAHFRDFAVRNFNSAALAGDASAPRYHAIDAQIPEELPAKILKPSVQLNFPGEWAHAAKMQPLTAQYEHFVVDPHIRSVRIDLQTLSDSGFLQADVLAKVGGAWERRRVPGLVFEFCRDDAPDDISELYLILSHHNRRSGTVAEGDYQIRTRFDCPGGWQGSIRFVHTQVSDHVYEGPAGTETYSLTEREEQTWIPVGTTEGHNGPLTFDQVDLNWSASYERHAVLDFDPAACLGDVAHSVEDVAGSATGIDPVAMNPMGGGAYMLQPTELTDGEIPCTGSVSYELCTGDTGGNELTDTRYDYLGALLAQVQGLAMLTPPPDGSERYVGNATVLHSELPEEGGSTVLDQTVTWDLTRR